MLLHTSSSAHADAFSSPTADCVPLSRSLPAQISAALHFVPGASVHGLMPSVTSFRGPGGELIHPTLGLLRRRSEVVTQRFLGVTSPQRLRRRLSNPGSLVAFTSKATGDERGFRTSMMTSSD